MAAAIRAEPHPPDRAFDRFLPADLSDVSLQYWTPLRVVKRAATWLEEIDARHIVDVGSGAGKFCVAGALVSQARFTGIEQSASLVASARRLARTFGVHERVTFVHASFGAASLPAADVYYFYNPFGSYWFQSRRDDEPDVTCSTERRTGEVAFAETFIAGLPPGTHLLTYHGFGGRMPECCELRQIDLTLAGGLRLWRRR